MYGTPPGTSAPAVPSVDVLPYIAGALSAVASALPAQFGREALLPVIFNPHLLLTPLLSREAAPPRLAAVSLLHTLFQCPAAVAAVAVALGVQGYNHPLVRQISSNFVGDSGAGAFSGYRTMAAGAAAVARSGSGNYPNATATNALTAAGAHAEMMDHDHHHPHPHLSRPIVSNQGFVVPQQPSPPPPYDKTCLDSTAAINLMARLLEALELEEAEEAGSQGSGDGAIGGSSGGDGDGIEYGSGLWLSYSLPRRTLQLLAALLELGHEALLAALAGSHWL
ncbi:hypothetical protein Agub_g905, partial [Astrephomene gubernaculifera]